jgi:hypothetical protein
MLREDTTHPESPSASAKELVVYRGSKGVTWIGVGPTAESDAKAPVRPCVARAAGAKRGGPVRLEEWLEEARANASHALLYGSNAGPVGRFLSQCGATVRVVRCHDRDDALRAARALSDPGDTVLSTAHGLLIFPEAGFYWHQIDLSEAWRSASSPGEPAPAA